MRNIKTPCIYLVFSFVSVVLIIILTGISRPDPPRLPFFEKIGITGVFIFFCIIGISFTLRPNWLRRCFSKVKNEEKNIPLQGKRSFQGHHPDCSIFQNHTIVLNKKIWCAGCLGFFIGLCAAIFFMILYMTIDFPWTKTIFLLFLLLGLLILPVVFGETLYRSRSALSHVVINSLLPLSFLLITIAVGGITGQSVYGFFTILLCFLWLDTRIQLSKWRHSRLCAQCSEPCKMFPSLA